MSETNSTRGSYPGVSPELAQIISGHAINGDPVLTEILLELERRTNVVVYFADFVNRAIPWISDSCQTLVGYSPEDFIKGGPDFIFSITDKDLIPGLIRQQLHYSAAAKAPGFDPRSTELSEFHVVVRTGDERMVPLTCLCTILTYCRNGDFDIGCCVWMPPVTQVVAECRATLISLKERHNQVYIHPAFEISRGLQPKVHGTSELHDKKITKRETEVLELLAQGNSTREISSLLNISLNTIETHRKHLLEKFQARNTAELIKKASKVIWLK
jgi:two-component system response regulator NreC